MLFVERGYIATSCSSVENGNPLFWEDEVAEEVTGGPIAPPTMLSVWFRPHQWAPGRDKQLLPLQGHFDLKEAFGLPEAVMTDNTLTFHEPVRPGDVISHAQVLRSVSGPKTTKLGSGRFWVIDIEYRNQDDDLVGVESYTGFGYRRDGGGARRISKLRRISSSCSRRWMPRIKRERHAEAEASRGLHLAGN